MIKKVRILLYNFMNPKLRLLEDFFILNVTNKHKNSSFCESVLFFQKCIFLQNISYRSWSTCAVNNLYLSSVTLCLDWMLTNCCLYRLLPWWCRWFSTRILATRRDVSCLHWQHCNSSRNLICTQFSLYKVCFLFLLLDTDR